uniref:Major facilitator superfamily (MFS) profile domain-containing protein n=1 Tax=Lygus hesperus TaxID=30085 RepID=A0A0K8TAE5_LYGHE
MPCENKGCMPQRFVVALLCFFGLTISYVMRFCLSMAIIEMAEAPKVKEDPNACPYPEDYVVSNSTKVAEYQWTEETQGLIQASFFWGYVCSQLPGGMLADRIGARYVIILGAMLTSLFTIVTPLATAVGDSTGLIIVRICIGLAQGIMYPSLHIVVAQWIPKKERATWTTVVFSGSLSGNAINYMTSGLLLGPLNLSWQHIFHIYGSIGILWTVVFGLMTYDTPQDHPYLSETEKVALAELMDTNTRQKNEDVKTPWGAILLSMPVWAINVAMIGHDWGLFAQIADLPKFMKSVLHINVKANGMLNALSYCLIWVVSILSGVLVDVLERKNIISTTLNRKLGTTLASVGPSLGLLGAVYTNCDSTLAVIYLLVGLAFMGFYYPSLKVNVIDLTTRHSGAVAGLTTMIGASSGVTVPYLIGYLTPNSTLHEWRIVMWLTFIVMSATNIFYIVFGASDVQPWNSPTEKDPELTTYDNPALAREGGDGKTHQETKY